MCVWTPTRPLPHHNTSENFTFQQFYWEHTLHVLKQWRCFTTLSLQLWTKEVSKFWATSSYIKSWQIIKSVLKICLCTYLINIFLYVITFNFFQSRLNFSCSIWSSNTILYSFWLKISQVHSYTTPKIHTFPQHFYVFSLTFTMHFLDCFVFCW